MLTSIFIFLYTFTQIYNFRASPGLCIYTRNYKEDLNLMNAKRKKKILLLASTSILAASTAAVMAFSFSNGLANARGLGEVVNGSITWTVGTTEKSAETNQKVSWTAKTASGTSISLYTYGQWDPTGVKMFDSKASDFFEYGLFVKSAPGSASSLFQFQCITSVTIVTTDSQASSSYSIYTNASSSGAAAATQVLSGKAAYEEETHTFTSEVAGARYLAIKPVSKDAYFGVKSVTITYSCEPGGPSEYAISKSEDVGYTIGLEKSSATAGENVIFSVNVATGYTLNSVSVKQGSDDVPVFGPSAGAYSFVMPSGEVEISASLSGLHHIAFGYGYKTQYLLGDTFEKPSVFAYYYGSSIGEEVTASATASGYNMSVAGEQTVTVSYTDSNSATVTKQYTIKVTDPAAGYSVSYEALDGMTGDPLVLSEYLLEGCVLPSNCEGGNTLTIVTSNVKSGYVVGWVQTSDWEDFDTQDGTTWTYTMPNYDITVQLLIFEE